MGPVWTMNRSGRENLTRLMAAVLALLIGAVVWLCFFLMADKGKWGGSPAWWGWVAGGISAFIARRFFTRKYRRRKVLLARGFPPAWEGILIERVPYYAALDDGLKKRFRDRVLFFMHEVRITGVRTEIHDTDRLLAAAGAVIPVLGIPDWEYDAIHDVLIYPTSFGSDFSLSGEDRNVLGMVITGTATLIVSKPSLEAGFHNMRDGDNTVIHEFAHKIDQQDGFVDGVPSLLLTREEVGLWREVAASVTKEIEAGRSPIRNYALTNPAEFFAVVTEVYFEKPEALHREHPRLHALLKKLFRQDTRSLFKGAARDLFRLRNRKIGRNARCPCGSGKKYKKCCIWKKAS